MTWHRSRRGSHRRPYQHRRDRAAQLAQVRLNAARTGVVGHRWQTIVIFVEPAERNQP